MTMYPVKYEILDEHKELVCKFELFDGDVFEVEIKKNVYTGDELRKIAKYLDLAEEKTRKGFNNE